MILIVLAALQLVDDPLDVGQLVRSINLAVRGKNLLDERRSRSG